MKGLEASICEPNVRFVSLADICSAKGYVRFTPNSDRKSGFPNKVMSALPPKPDMCSALAYVCFGPEADIAALFGSLRYACAFRVLPTERASGGL